MVSISSLDRIKDKGETETKSVPRVIAESFGRDIDEVYRNTDVGVVADENLLQRITEGSRDAVRALVSNIVNADGRIYTVVAFDIGGFIDEFRGKKFGMDEALKKNGCDKVGNETM